MFGQFIVQYDVDMDSSGGNEIQVLDGYFVHHFAPENLQTLPRHVIFVVDVSGSMHGTKLKQTKDAMVTILDDMTEQDYFDIITFSTGVSYWQSDENIEKFKLLQAKTTTTTTPLPTTTEEEIVTETEPPYLQVQQMVQQVRHKRVCCFSSNMFISQLDHVLRNNISIIFSSRFNKRPQDCPKLQSTLT